MNYKITSSAVAMAMALACVCSHALSASTPREEIMADKMLSTANHRYYPEPDRTVKIAQAPKDYVPFHISTYARHGSRYLISKSDYENALAPILSADKAGVLSPTGKIVKDRLLKIKSMADEKRYGELTPGGAEQHRGIARRMYSNFPEIFADSVAVTARSTNVLRCVMSMMAECLELQSINPTLKINHDASEADMYKLNDYRCADSLIRKYRHIINPDVDTFKARLDGNRLMSELYTDADWVKKNIPDPHKKLWDFFYVASNMQSHTDPDLDLMWVLTPEECYQCWLVNNVQWYLTSGDSPLTGREMQYQQANLLRDFIEDGDNYAKSREQGATLRFGHESIVLPTVVLMELDDYDYVTDDIFTLSDNWANYHIFPMAANIQWVFYANPDAPDSDILVRALLNEKDVRLPVKSDIAPFYRWNDVSDYYKAKLTSHGR